jgi:hypothetical protein
MTGSVARMRWRMKRGIQNGPFLLPWEKVAGEAGRMRENH